MNETRPSHYQVGKIEPIDVIQDWELNFCLGNVIKYVARSGKKVGATKEDDLRKAIQYLEFELENVRRKEKSK